MKLFIFQGSARRSYYGAGAAIIAEDIEHAETLLHTHQQAPMDRKWAEGVERIGISAMEQCYKRSGPEIAIRIRLFTTEDECAAAGDRYRDSLVLVESFDMPHDSPRVVMFQQHDG